MQAFLFKRHFAESIRFPVCIIKWQLSCFPNWIGYRIIGNMLENQEKAMAENFTEVLEFVQSWFILSLW